MPEEQGRYFIKNYALAHMSSYSNYPRSLLDAMQVRTLIGPRGAIAEQDLWVSAFQLDPGTVYSAHAHPGSHVVARTRGRDHVADALASRST